MKQGIHPEYKLATVHCACGNAFQTRSTQDDIHVDVCSVCHPYFTGRQRLMDTAGRVERFRRKWGGSEGGPGSNGGTEAGEAEEVEPEAGSESEAKAEAEVEAKAAADSEAGGEAESGEVAEGAEGAEEEKAS